MKLQFPFTIGVFVAGFGALGCGVSNSEIPDKSWWGQDAAVADGSVPGSDASSAANGGSGGDGSAYQGKDGGTQHHGGGSGGSGGSGGGSSVPVDAGGGGDAPLDAGVDAGDSGSSPIDAGGGGTGGGGEPVAGSGGAPAGGSGGTGGSAGNTCPTDYTLATHIKMNVTWPKKTMTVLGVPITVVEAGSGVVHIWTKSKFNEDGSTADVVSRSCGSTLPEITSIGGDKILPEIPNASWEKSSMPTFTGTSTKNGTSVTASPGVALVGLTMSTDPTASWPSRTSIMGVDHDSDTHLGLAAIPKTGGSYKQIPVDTSRNKRADRVDLAIRNVMTLSATVEGCPDTYTGTANVTKFNNHIIGCHIAGGNECTETQVKFVDDNTVVYTVGSATYNAKRVSDTASCADVRAAVP